VATATLWNALDQAANQPDQRNRGLWTWLRERIALTHYRPEPVSGVEVSHLSGRDGDYHILKNPRTKTYYRLSDQDYFLWQQMDGTRTVKDLVVAYFLAYGSFAFGRAATLVEGLKSRCMLTDQPVDVYQHVRGQLQRRRLSHRLTDIARGFLQMAFAIRGLDPVMDAIYRRGGWLLFTRPLQALFPVVSVAGLVLFAHLSRTARYGLVTIGGSYRWGVIGLVAANLAAIFVHELSHALTVKHYGRELRRGGFMLYFGLPAFFMDTTDIWMEGKRARLAVTWAGPYSGLILGGLASAVMAIWPAFPLNALLFQFAFFAYLTVFLNLNPLLELDGYFILMDWLEIPMLRQKSLAFIRRGLWEKIKALKEAGQTLREWLASFSREERIFTIFGTLSTIWTAYAITSGVHLWQRRLAGAIRGLWNQGGVAKTILALIIGAVGLLFALSLGMALLRLAAWALRWLARRDLFANVWAVAAILLVVALVLSLAPRYLEHPLLAPIFSLLALLAAGVLAWRSARAYAGARYAGTFRMLAVFSSALLLRLVVSLAREQIGSVTAAWSAQALRLLAVSLGHLAYGSLLGAGLILLSHTDLRTLRRSTKLLLTLGLLGSYGLVLLLVHQGQGEALLGLEALLAVSSALFPLLTLTSLLPTLLTFWETSFAPAWAAVVLALGTQVGAVLLGQPPLLPYLLMGAGLFLHHLAYRQITLPQDRPEPGLTLSDGERLQRAFRWTASSLFSQVCQIVGLRSARRLGERFNNRALAAGWDLRLAQGDVMEDVPNDQSLIERGVHYADALSMLLDMVACEVGERLTVRALQRAYDALPWEERETGGQYMFRDVKRAAALSRTFQATQQHYRGLLRRNALFATMDEAEIDLLVSRLKPATVAAGQAIIRQGDRGDTFYIVKRGHVEVTQRDERGVPRVVNQLDRGDAFGELALLHDAPRNATCRATVPTEVLCLSRQAFDRLVRARYSLRKKVDRSIARADLLRRMPLFAELDAHQIQRVASQLREETYDQGAVVIRQGEIGETFYVIEQGRVRVWVEGEEGEEAIIDERGPGEYVGEIALLLDVPRTATVTAATETTLLSLHKDDFEDLVTKHLYVSRGLERETSRRMIDLRRAYSASVD
jgi:putative peptide zinc metalloprotease protein